MLFQAVMKFLSRSKFIKISLKRGKVYWYKGFFGIKLFVFDSCQKDFSKTKTMLPGRSSDNRAIYTSENKLRPK